MTLACLSQAKCTALVNTTVFMSWDFGVISTRGISTDVQLIDVNVLDSKHAGVLILRVGGIADPAQVSSHWSAGIQKLLFKCYTALIVLPNHL